MPSVGAHIVEEAAPAAALHIEGAAPAPAPAPAPALHQVEASQRASSETTRKKLQKFKKRMKT